MKRPTTKATPRGQTRRRRAAWDRNNSASTQRLAAIANPSVEKTLLQPINDGDNPTAKSVNHAAPRPYPDRATAWTRYIVDNAITIAWATSGPVNDRPATVQTAATKAGNPGSWLPPQ